MNSHDAGQISHPMRLNPNRATPGLSAGGDQNSGPSSVSTRRRSKHVSRACNTCRRKKTRCNGERPACALCILNKEECAYDLTEDRRRPVPKSYVAALEARVARLESLLGERAEQGIGGETENEGDDTGIEEPGNPALDQRPMRSSGKTSQPVEYLQIDNTTGEVREYGPTSMFKHLPATESSPGSSAQFGASPHSIDARLLEEGSISALSDNFDEEMHQTTLRVFFTYFNPWCWWVDEKRFRDDMTLAPAQPGTIVRRDLRTAYYSPLLHFAILATGVMYLDNVDYADRDLLANIFARSATKFFEEEIEAAKLSAVSGLMVLGTHHAGHARQGLGYIYAGIGMRLTRIQGLGIDASSWVDKGLISQETKRSRDRVWHTAYVQDKLWSTYVGRAPAPNLSHGQMPFPTVSEEEDATPWGFIDQYGCEHTRSSLASSTFTWTCKLARIVELILTNIYSSRQSAYSEKAQNAKYEIWVLLEKWNGELPEQLRVSASMFRNQNTTMILPHVLVMNMLSQFAVILLNRPDYCDTTRPQRTASMTQNTTTTTTATERCNQAALRLLRLAELFDRSIGLRYAPVSMTQFIFTAGTIHLLAVASGKRIDTDTELVRGCIAVLHSMGQTWKCALQSGDALRRLLHGWHPSANSDAPITNSTTVNTSEQRGEGQVDIEVMLQQNPDVAQQLRRLGWAPPRPTVSPGSAGSTTGLETLRTTPGFTIGGSEPVTAQPSLVSHETEIDDISWMSQPSGWTDHAYSYTLPSIQEQTLLEMLMGTDAAAPGIWSNPLFPSQGEGPQSFFIP